MQFFVLGYDGADEGAPGRRAAMREQHLAGAKQLREQNHLISAAALLDSDGNMAGSAMIVEFESEAALRSLWLDTEPYVVGGVWQTLEVTPCAVPGFLR